MGLSQWTTLLCRLACCCYFAMAFAGCGGSHEETVAGVKLPIPGGMTKSGEKGIELSMPGFGGGQASYQGNIEPEKIVEFYKKEMPARGWQSSGAVTAQGGMLTYAQDSRSVVVMVAKQSSGTNLTITVGSARQ